MTYLGHRDTRVIGQVFQCTVIFVCRELSGEGYDVKLAQDMDSCTRLGVMDCGRKPIDPQQLLSCRYTLVTTTKLHCDMMNSSRVDDGEIFMASLRHEATHVDVAKLYYKAEGA